MKKLLLLLTMLLAFGEARATTATSASQIAVETAIANTAVGGTVIVPSGSANWSGMAIAKAVTIQGAGAGSTNITLTGQNTITKQAGGLTKITGFTFAHAGGAFKGFVIDGSWLSAEPVVITNCDFTINGGSGVLRISTPGGVIISGCNFTGGWDDSFIQPKQPGDSYGSWTHNSTLGTADSTGKRNTYVETCHFFGGTNQGIDADDASRVVFRNNICDYTSFNSHGMDTSEDGVRHFEVYNNTFRNSSVPGTVPTDQITNQNWIIWIRGGSGVIFNNSFDDIANGWWGNKNEGKFDIRAQEDNSGVSYGTVAPPTAKYSCGQGNYPRERQLGQSWNESLSNSVGIAGGVGDYVTDPIYVWGNTGAGSSGGSFLLWANGGSWGSQTGYFNSGRDYVFGNTPKPGYTAYAYPHPLATGTVVPDTTPPTLGTPSINAAGTTLTLPFSEVVQTGSAGSGGWTLQASGGAATLSFASGTGSPTLLYTISRAIQAGETVTVSYTQPGDGIEDLPPAGNDLASFSNRVVTNGSTQGQVVATPVIAPAAGTYSTAQSATITCATTGAVIHYTTNGTTPTGASTTYGGPISIPSTLTLKAMATKTGGFTDSGVASSLFTISIVTNPPGARYIGLRGVPAAGGSTP